MQLEGKWKKYLPKKKQWWILLLVGVLLMVIAIPTEKDTKQNLVLDKNQRNSESTELEKRLEDLLENMQKVGNVRVMITEQRNGDIEGIVVLAEGGDNAVIVRQITEVVQALFAIDAHKIKVIGSNLKQEGETQ